MRKVRRVFKRVAGPNLSRDAQKLGSLIERLACENVFLCTENKGLKTAVVTEKKRRKRGKPLLQTIPSDNGSKAQFFSPTKITTAQRLLKEKEEQEEQEILRKEEEKAEKKRKKEEEARQVAQRRQTREANAAAKKQAKADATMERLANKQLQNELKAALPDPKRKAPIRKKVVIIVSDIKSDDEVVVVERLTPRPRRSARMPRRFNDSKIY
jgi:hypothetical protein